MKKAKITDVGVAPSRRPRGRGNPVSVAEKTAIQALALSGVSGRAIAQSTGRSEKTIARVLSTQEFEDAKALARSTLAGHANEMAHAWIEAAKVSAQKGGHEAARDLLQGIGAVEKPGARKTDGKRGLVVQVGIVLPGLGIEQAPTVTMPTVATQQIEDAEVFSTTDDDADPIP